MTREPKYIDHYQVSGAGRTHKVCPKCEGVVNVNNFRVRKSGALQSYCTPCSNEIGCKWARENKDEHNRNQRSFYQKNKSAIRDRVKQDRAENPCKYKLYNQNFRARNPDRVRELQKRHYWRNRDAMLGKSKNWRKSNPSANAEKSMRYEAAKRMAVPSWANMDDIKRVYEVCRMISEKTGVPHQVDHVLPIQSDLVCGFHVYENLAIIPAYMNAKKSNKEWPGKFNDIA